MTSYSIQDISKELNVSESEVCQWVFLYNLPQEIQDDHIFLNETAYDILIKRAQMQQLAKGESYTLPGSSHRQLSIFDLLCAS